jgi:hypothetical protein
MEYRDHTHQIEARTKSLAPMDFPTLPKNSTMQLLGKIDWGVLLIYRNLDFT